VDSLRLMALFALATVGADPSMAAESEPAKDDLVREFMKVIPPDTFSNVRTFEVNGFAIESSRYKQLGVPGKGLTPNGNEIEAVVVTAPGFLKAVVAKGVPPTIGGGLDVFHRDSGTPLVSFADSNGDGALDFIQYSTVDASGKPLVQVMDYDANGQADLRIQFVDGYFEIWHRDRWYRAETREGKRGIVLDGRFVELRNEKNHWLVP
jgi:hypothetical protein